MCILIYNCNSLLDNFKMLIPLLTFKHVKCSECSFSMSSTMMDWEKGKEKYKCLVLCVVNI